MENTTINFYESKKKLVFLAIMSFAFGLICFFMTYVFFDESDYLVGVLMLAAGLLCFFAAYRTGKKVSGKNPHVRMTEEHLIIYVLTDHPVEFRWEDIRGYILYSIYGNAFIGLKLDREDYYDQQMPQSAKKLSKANVKMGYPQYNIVVAHLKEKERLLEELEKRTPQADIYQGEDKTYSGA
ncbi:STM3941 family protein [Thalassobacillus hwangdonensis]|uniref:STM3941 family protein n=1 Tax=Thalassobacillus hwangdonensis TaxID=546108 RepID=A0ABW3L702_9BACI